MITLSANDQVYICVESIDFRKLISGLIGLTQSSLEENPYSQNYFAFINKKRTAIKILHYDGQGYWMHLKRLSKGKFKWPSSQQKRIALSPTDLQVLMLNRDYRDAKVEWAWRKVA